jgi:uncharacterized protein (DUF433 family)
MSYNSRSMADNTYIDARDGGFYLRGTRVPLDGIVHEFRNGASPETIRQTFPTLDLEQVYGAITFYLAHQEHVDASIRKAERACSEFADAHPIPKSIANRLREARGRTANPRKR